MHAALEKAQEEGWRNITDHTLELKEKYIHITKLKPASGRMNTRGSITPKSIFLRIMQPTIKHLTTAVNSSLRTTRDESTPGPSPLITEEDMCRFIGALVEMCGKRIHRQETYFTGSEAPSYSYRQWKKIRQHLSGFNPKVLFSRFNDGLHAVVMIGGHGANDEAIWEYFGNSEHVVCIPRKPHSTGFRAYKWCFPLTLSGRPVVYHVLPDIRKPCYTGIETMDTLLKLWPSDAKISTTADSFFCNLNWLRNHSEPVTFAVPADNFPYTQLFANNLRWHEYRVFTDGKIILTFWLDNKLVITASNAFQAIPPAGGEANYRGVDCSDLQPHLSVAAIQKLNSTFTLEELKALAARSSVSTSMIF